MLSPSSSPSQRVAEVKDATSPGKTSDPVGQDDGLRASMANGDTEWTESVVIKALYSSNRNKSEAALVTFDWQHLQDVAEHPHTPHVGGWGDGLQVDDLRRRKAWRAVVQGLLGGRQSPRQPKVDQLDGVDAVASQKQVGWLHTQ